MDQFKKKNWEKELYGLIGATSLRKNRELGIWETWRIGKSEG